MTRADRAFPWRGVFLGAVMAFVVVASSITYNMRMASQGISNDFLAACAIFYLVVISGVLNPLLRLVSPKLSFSGRDLLVALSMMLVASAIPSWGLTQMWISTVTGWQYFASPENQWRELFIPYLRKPTVVTDTLAIQYLYEGLPKGESIPWSSWIGVLVFWFPFYLSIYVGTISLMVLLRKQWVEHERLAFPMMQFGAELCRQEKDAILPPFFKERAMWMGATIPIVIISYNGLAAFIPLLTPFSLHTYIRVLRHTVYYNVNLNFPALGFAYLVGLDVSLSLWLFHVLWKLQVGLITTFAGPVLSGTHILYCSSPITAHEGFGTMIVLFLFGLWVARKRLSRIVLTGLLFRRTEEDAHEIASYRAAVWTALVCLAVVFSYLTHLGLKPFHAVAFLVAAAVIFYSITRVICEGGVGFARSVYIPNAFLANQIGTANLGLEGLTSLGFHFTWSGDLRTIVMTQAMQGMRLTEEIQRRRPLMLCFVATIFIAFFGSVFTALTLGYKYGLFNCQGSWPVWPCGVYHWNTIANLMKSPHAPSVAGWSFIGIGALMMAALIFLRQQFVWWPVHYIGLPVCGSLPMQWLWFSVFLAWLVKVFILKFASNEFYEKTRMFFLGMIFGSLAAGGVWTLVGAITQHPAPYLRGVTLG